MIRKGNRLPCQLRRGDRKIHMLFKSGRVIYLTPEALKTALHEWLKSMLVGAVAAQRESIGGACISRVLEADGEKWFEFEFTLRAELDGNAEDGWTHPEHKVRLTLQRSETLTSWTEGEFVDSPGSPIDNMDGTWTYKARSKFPQDSAIKSGVITCAAVPSLGQPDPRNNPFTGVTLAGVSQSLPNFPYEMPDDAAQLQTDLRAAGWDGATVTATTDLDWVVTIPDVELTSYTQASRISWPGYYVEDMFGDLTVVVDHRPFQGEWLNADGVRTAVSKQFARLKADIIPAP